MAQWMTNWGRHGSQRIQVCPHPAPISRDLGPMTEAMEVWLSNPVRPGRYFWAYDVEIQRYVFYFEDAHLAVEFRMRWG